MANFRFKQLGQTLAEVALPDGGRVVIDVNQSLVRVYLIDDDDEAVIREVWAHIDELQVRKRD